MTDTPDPATYVQRLNALEATRTYRLNDNGVAWVISGGVERHLAFDQIAQVRMTFAPSRVQRNRYLTQIEARDGSELVISNESYRGFADFADQSAAYAAFIRELHLRLAAHGSGVVFRKGNSPFGYILNVLITVLIFATIAFAFVLLMAWGLVWIAVVKLLIVLYFAPTLVRFILRGKPASYDPRNLSPDALPATA